MQSAERTMRHMPPRLRQRGCLHQDALLSPLPQSLPFKTPNKQQAVLHGRDGEAAKLAKSSG